MSDFAVAYADLTVNDRNPVKRWLQRRRFTDALSVLAGAPMDRRMRIVDFGAGNGELVRLAASRSSIEALVYEPSPALMAEAKDRLAGCGSVQFAERLDSVESGVFDYVFCLEVFEHLPDGKTITAIREIHRLLRSGGTAVVGVPYELFLPALLKGAFRMIRRRGAFDANALNILRAVVGRPPKNRPVAEIAPGVPFHFFHLGFDHRKLEHSLFEHFELVKKWYSPVCAIGPILNSEIYYSLRKPCTSRLVR